MATLPPSVSVSPSRTTCASLLRELQIIWDEIGESDAERDKMLLQLEQDCLNIYRRKVENTRNYKASLHQSLAEAEVEINNIVSALGEHASLSQFEKGKGTLKHQISAIKPILEEMRLRKKQRVKEFLDIQSQISCICAEIAGNDQSNDYGDPPVNEHDLTAKRLAELKLHLKELQTEKALRLQKVTSHLGFIHELCIIMSIDFLDAVYEVHPSLSNPACGYSKSISNDTLARLTDLINSLKQQKQQRIIKLQDLGNMLIELWNLMDTPTTDRKRFDHVTSLVSSSIDEVSREGCLSLQVIEQTEVEVERLNTVKASKLRELVFKRQNELEEIYGGVHMDVDCDAARRILTDLIDSGNVDLSDLLLSMDDQIVKAKEQAISRRDILDRVEKWKFASEEEKWLDDYERDENRYSAGKGAHKNLKRAEKARIVVNKIPSMVDSLTAKVKAWERDKGVPFLYDKFPILKILEEYTVQRMEREQDKRKSREQKRLQEQLAVEQEVLFGSRPTPKKPLGLSTTNANTMTGTPIGSRAATALGRHGVSAGKERRESGRANNITPVNYVALPKDDSVSRGN